MNEMTWFRSHVEQLLREVWEVQEVFSDGDGDYPTRVGGAPVWVRVEGGHPMSVWIYAHAVVGVKRSATLLAELNRLSAASRFCAVHWVAGCVVVEYSLPSSVVTADTLAGIMGVVGGRADDLGPLLVPMFGGRLPFDVDPAVSHAVDPDVACPGVPRRPSGGRFVALRREHRPGTRCPTREVQEASPRSTSLQPQGDGP